MKEEEISDEDVPDVVSTFYEGKTEVFDIKEKAKKMNKKVETKGIPDVRYVKKTKPKEEADKSSAGINHSLAAGLLKWSNTFTQKMPFGIPKELSHEASENFAKKLEKMGPPKKSTSKQEKSDQSRNKEDEMENDKFEEKYYSKKYVYFTLSIYNSSSTYIFYLLIHLQNT